MIPPFVKPTHYALLVFVVALVAGIASGTDEADESLDSMQKKLVYSQNILSGLATEDFDAILKNATALNELGKQRWTENETPAYRAQHQVFWFANEELIRMAEEKNIDGAALSYVQMTLSCVNCHKALRSQ